MTAAGWLEQLRWRLATALLGRGVGETTNLLHLREDWPSDARREGSDRVLLVFAGSRASGRKFAEIARDFVDGKEEAEIARDFVDGAGTGGEG